MTARLKVWQKKVKDFEKGVIDSKQKNAIKLKRKVEGHYTRIRHQCGVGEEDGNNGCL